MVKLLNGLSWLAAGAALYQFGRTLMNYHEEVNAWRAKKLAGMERNRRLYRLAKGYQLGAYSNN